MDIEDHEEWDRRRVGQASFGRNLARQIGTPIIPGEGSNQDDGCPELPR